MHPTSSYWNLPPPLSSTVYKVRSPNVSANHVSSFLFTAPTLWRTGVGQLKVCTVTPQCDQRTDATIINWFLTSSGQQDDGRTWQHHDHFQRTEARQNVCAGWVCLFLKSKSFFESHIQLTCIFILLAELHHITPALAKKVLKSTQS